MTTDRVTALLAKWEAERDSWRAKAEEASEMNDHPAAQAFDGASNEIGRRAAELREAIES